jgi:hypothetical protein
MGKNKQQKRTHHQPVTNELISNNAAANGNGATMSAYKEPTYTAKAEMSTVLGSHVMKSSQKILHSTKWRLVIVFKWVKRIYVKIII